MGLLIQMRRLERTGSSTAAPMGQMASSPWSGSRMMPETKAVVAAAGGPGRTAMVLLTRGVAWRGVVWRGVSTMQCGAVRGWGDWGLHTGDE